MDSPTYIQNATRTESVPANVVIDQLALAGILRMAILTGKLVDMAKRQIFYGKPIVNEELGPVALLLSKGAHVLAKGAANGIDMNQPIAQADLDKDELGHYKLANLNVRLLHAAMGCLTESAELIEAINKQYETGELDLVNFGEEIGDIEWYQAIGFDATGVTEASCREKNIAKLRARYPDKFDANQAVNRDLEAERKTLE